MSKKVLIVDDESDFRLVLSDVLSRAGYAIVEASSAEEALAKVPIEKPDLAIVDWMMPGMSGPELCQALRHDLQMPKLPIIILTVRQRDEDQAEGLHQGADLYLVKPVKPDEILLRVASLLRE